MTTNLDRNVLVTGGGSGIGLGAAKALAESGCRVAICGRRPDVLKSAAEDSNPALMHHQVDVADRKSVKKLFAWANEAMGSVDVLINSAGTNIRTRTMSTMTPEQWDHVLNINATGAYNCMYEVLPQMRERGDGLIINVSSIAGKRASELGGVAYAASKFAMSALGTAVANEDAPNGIRVTNLYPGEVNTPILENRPVPVSDEHKASILQSEDVASMIVAIVALPPRAHVPEIVIKPTKQEYV